MTLPVGDVVSVHLNLTTNRWVVAPKPKGKVLGYADAVTLEDVTFRVYERQRQYCLDKGARWVHAYAIGTLVATSPVDVDGWTQVTYNPFRAPTFHVVSHEWPIVAHRGTVHFVDRYGYLQ